MAARLPPGAGAVGCVGLSWDSKGYERFRKVSKPFGSFLPKVETFRNSKGFVFRKVSKGFDPLFPKVERFRNSKSFETFRPFERFRKTKDFERLVFRNLSKPFETFRNPSKPFERSKDFERSRFSGLFGRRFNTIMIVRRLQTRTRLICKNQLTS